MNLQLTPSDPPLRLLVVNPLTPGSKLAITEILLGTVFGPNRYIDLILLVYSNEIAAAEHFKMELRGCAFSCCNSIVVSSDLPSLSDADVFMFITNFPNPNKINFTKIDSEEHFDTMYLILKVANNLTTSLPAKEIVVEDETKRKKKIPERKPLKPVIVADGLLVLHILKQVCKDLPPDIMFCPSPVPVAARSALADYLKIETNKFNHVHVWAADDEVFYFEIEKPLILRDNIKDKGPCGKDIVGTELLESFNFDYLQLSESWLKTELVEKVASNLVKNPYGNIYRALETVRILQYIWKSRMTEDLQVYINMGVISDGSLGTIKGCPCVQPLIFFEENWTVNKLFERDSYLHHEIKRINKRAKEHTDKLIPYCKKFLEDNVIQQNFIPIEEDMTTMSVTTSNNTEYQ